MNKSEPKNAVFYDKDFIPSQILKECIKNKTRVIVYATTGAKVTGIIKGFDNFNISLHDNDLNTIYLFKGNIFYIEVSKNANSST
jgi:RNA chaperone Hfq